MLLFFKLILRINFRLFFPLDFFSALFFFMQFGNVQNTEHNSDCCFAQHLVSGQTRNMRNWSSNKAKGQNLGKAFPPYFG